VPYFPKAAHRDQQRDVRRPHAPLNPETE